MSDRLPIEDHIPDIRKALGKHGCVVIEATPGAGKTTLVPLALLGEPCLQGKHIVILEPRRLAARMAAARMAYLLGEPVGKTVGYQIKNDRKISPETRIHVLTEGILTRRIQSDPLLQHTGLVIFDEFHERNLVSDLGLALCLEIKEALRDDLNIIIMSATMDSKAVSSMMGQAPIVCCEGRQFPVETRYLKRKAMGSLERTCTDYVVESLSRHEGDILVFLPGAGEIKRVSALIHEKLDDPDVSVYPLYGNLDKKDQDSAIRPSGPGKRKIVLATSIAETSLTIEGVRIVIDAGFVRRPRYFSGTGMSRLETLPVSKAGADQRRGRAGRLGPGICYRLWPDDETILHQDFSSPEILNVDLTSFVLELALWGVQDPEQLKWLDLPPKGAFGQARDLLIRLKALDITGHITSHGKTMAGLGVHPRLAHMLLVAKTLGKGSLACLMAALLHEGDFLIQKDQIRESDIRIRLQILDEFKRKEMSILNRTPLNKGRVNAILQSSSLFEHNLGITPSRICDDHAGFLLAHAYPERIALGVDNRGSFKLASKMAAYLQDTDPLAQEPMIVCADMDGNLSRSKIYLAAPYDRVQFEQDFKDLIEQKTSLYWDGVTIVSSMRRTYGQLLLSETPSRCSDESLITALMLRVIQEQGIDILPWTPPLNHIRDRAIFLKQIESFEDIPDLSNQALTKTLEFWLGPFLSGIRSLNQLKKIDLSSALLSLLSYRERQTLDHHAPSHLRVPSGSRIPLIYTSEGRHHSSPILAVRLQEMFGLVETPRIAAGRVPVTLHLLSPAGRPMQVTQNLESFWKSTYDQVRKDLKGRYPKHYWPDDPLNARATSRTKKKMDTP
ncbi:MAG: ATP-dependent helicase HrpB [Proteobacteria bacterium]|nr:ATP-dependent helicase HrpB [Pseudomonadota bacterium]